MAGPIKRSQSGFPKDPIGVTLKLGGRTCTMGQNVFAPWLEPATERRWYAARVVGIVGDKFHLEWAEGKEELLMDPDSVLLATEILQPGSIVGLPDQMADAAEFYQEYVMVHYRENGKCTVRGKRGVLSLRKFSEMMIEERDLPPADPQKDRADLLKGHCLLTTVSRLGYGMSPLALSVLIKKLGGTEKKSVEEVVEWQLGQGNPRLCFLLADEPLRTNKYMYCLAANIPCISSQWLVEMRRTKRYVHHENHRLAAGIDETHGVVSWQARKTLLNNLRVGIHGDVSFLEFWTPILAVGKGEAVALKPETSAAFATETSAAFATETSAAFAPDQLDIVMVQETAPADLIGICADQLVPLVTEQWLIHTLIHGKKRPFPAYRPAAE